MSQIAYVGDLAALWESYEQRERGESNVIDLIIQYGKYAPLGTAALLVWSAVRPPKPGAKWYVRYIIGGMGLVLLYVSIHMLLKSK